MAGEPDIDVPVVSLRAALALAIIHAGLVLELSEDDVMMFTEAELELIQRHAIAAGYTSTKDLESGVVTISKSTTPAL